MCMKLAESFTRLLPSILIFVFYGCSMAAVTMALKRLDLGIAYAVWAGVGTAIVAAIGILFFKEPASTLKMIAIMLIITGVIMLHLSRTSTA
ncbi:MAG: hypothetical protein AUK36_10510 [Zetaproteobacteria bacterium CG2_30_59_37]|nr:MAG: hypothetical protein AUK36_10510 [Zetaproteobacteria bacterium CG2_30_59_37]